jgi:hypothetical protein
VQALVDLSLGTVERLIEAVEGGARIVEECGGVDALEALVFQVLSKSLNCGKRSSNFRFVELRIRSNLQSKPRPKPKPQPKQKTPAV